MSRITRTVSRQWSLVPRLVAVLLILGLLLVVVGVTGVLASGAVAWAGLLVLSFLFGIFLEPLFGTQFGLFTTLLSHPVETTLLAGVVLAPVLYLPRVRTEIREFRTELGVSGDLASESHPELHEIASRLAQQAEIHPPAVSVVDRNRPESYAIGGRSNGTIVLTTELVNRLSRAEVTAVLAHEVSHLVNGDSRIMGLALTPLLFAEHIGSDDPPDLKWVIRSPLAYLFSLGAWAILSLVTRAQRLGSQLAIAVLSRERELAADRGAARLTGSPGDLASALGTLDRTRSRPVEDKRTWEQSASALDILPREESVAGDGPFRTHPKTDTRIRRLETMAAEMDDAA